MRKHGLRRHSAYHTWKRMMSRCYNKKDSNYKNYGGRGIKVTKRWHNVKNFVEDVGRRPKDKQLDRKNNNSGYSKRNCKWVTRKENMSNTRRTKLITHKGKKKSTKQWAREKGIPYSTLRKRLRAGWSLKKALKR